MEKVGEFFVGRPSGAVLFAGAGRVYVVEPDGTPRWIQDGCGHVHKCALAPDGSRRGEVLSERKSDGRLEFMADVGRDPARATWFYEVISERQ